MNRPTSLLNRLWPHADRDINFGSPPKWTTVADINENLEIGIGFSNTMFVIDSTSIVTPSASLIARQCPVEGSSDPPQTLVELCIRDGDCVVDRLTETTVERRSCLN